MAVRFGSKEELPNTIYYNMAIINNNTTDNVADPSVSFQDMRNEPIIEDASKYDFSIVRFTMNGPGLDLPLMEVPIQVGQTNPNKTIFSLTLALDVSGIQVVVGSTTYTFNQSTIVVGQPTVVGYSQQYLIYVPTDKSLTAPPVPSGGIVSQDVNSGYYWIYSYEELLGMLTTASVAAMNSIKAQYQLWFNASVANGGAGGIGQAPAILTHPPTVLYNSTTGLFTVYCDTYGFGGVDSKSARTAPSTTVTAEFFRLYFNTNLWGIIGNFNLKYYGQFALHGMTNEIVVNNLLGTNYYKPIDISGNTNVFDTHAYWQVVQDYPSTSSLWSPIAAIALVSTLIGTQSELEGPTIQLGTGNAGSSAQTVGQGLNKIITDVALPQTSATDYREFFQYSPPGEYRMVDLGSTKRSINQIDLKAYWRRRLTNELVPMLAYNQSNVTAKLMFRRKTTSLLYYLYELLSGQ